MTPHDYITHVLSLLGREAKTITVCVDTIIIDGVEYAGGVADADADGEFDAEADVAAGCWDSLRGSGAPVSA